MAARSTRSGAAEMTERVPGSTSTDPDPLLHSQRLTAGRTTGHAEFWRRRRLLGALLEPFSCVSWIPCVNAAETHETIRQESGMRYHPNHTI